MTHVTKIKGCAGAGKSYTTREEIVAELENGVAPVETCISSFTRAACEDIREGVKDAVESQDGLPSDFADGVSVETFNALCRRAAMVDGWGYKELIALDKKSDEEHFQAFFASEMKHISFATPNPEDFEMSTSGAKMINAFNQIRAAGYNDIEDFAREAQSLDLGCKQHEFLVFVALWSSWKRETGNRQHSDYVDYVRKNELIPERENGDKYRVLVIDEFQDLSPLQYAVYTQWRDSGEFDRIIIAGDAAQSVYGFRGADPRYFEKTPADKEIELSESRRCAPDVIEYADEIIKGEDYFSSKLSSTRSNNERVRVEKNHPLKSIDGLTRLVKWHGGEYSSTFILARRNKDVGKIAKALNKAGVPHLSVSPAAAERYEGLWYWDEPLPHLRLLFRNWDNGLLVNAEWIDAYLDNTTIDNRYSRSDKSVSVLLDRDSTAPDSEGDVMYPPEVMDIVTGGLTVREAIQSLDLDEGRVEALKNALRAGLEIYPGQIKIGTIHSAKGLEAESVILMGETTDKRFSKLQLGGEELAEEKRLYHVGVTRAMDSVFVASGLFGSKRSPALPR